MSPEKQDTSTSAFARSLEGRGVTFARDGEQLHVSAPKGVLSSTDIEFIRDRKEDLLAMLGAGASPHSPDSVPAPLGYLQERIWSHQQMFPDLALYNLAIAWRLSGPLKTDALVRALNAVINRHQSLRMRFDVVDGAPVSTCTPSADLELTVEPAPSDEASLLQRLEDLRDAPLALLDGEIFRTRLFRASDTDHVLFFMPHHLIWDGMSWDIFLRDLAAFYEAEVAGDRLELDSLSDAYAAAAEWDRRFLADGAMEEEAEFWKTYYSSKTPPIELPGETKRPQMFSFEGDAVCFRFDKDVFESVTRLAREHRCTKSIVLLAAWQAFLAQITGNADIVVGTPVSLRRSEETFGLIGCFVDALGVRQIVDGSASFASHLRATNDNLLSVADRRPAPLGLLASKVALPLDASRTPLYQAMFAYQDERERKAKLGEIGLDMIDIPPGGAPTDIRLEICEMSEEATGEINYSSDVMTAANAEYFKDCFLAFLEAAVASPERAVNTLPLMNAAQRDALLVDLNSTRSAYRRDALAFDYFDEMVAKRPDAAAVSMGEQTASYADLQSRANKIAHVLHDWGVTQGDVVGVYFDRSVEMVAAILGVWKTGAAMLPLDPEFPEKRLAYMVEDAKTKAIVTNGLGGDWVPESVDMIDLAKIADRVDDAPSVAPVLSHRDSRSRAYVIYTSGSTGNPKGVENTHQALCNFLETMMHRPGLSAEDRLLAVTTLSFDVALLELFVPLSAGAEVVLASDDDAMDGFALADIIEDRDISVLQGTPATWRILLDSDWDGARGLKALCGGEAMAPALAGALLEKVGALWNMYGPTETTVWSTCALIENADDIHVGRPVANTQAYILDDAGKPAPAGVAGDLWLGGDGVALGYLGKPELTAKSFRENPFTGEGRIYNTGDRARRRLDGEIDILGRRDEQVKIRGYRIELGDIETALSRHPSIRQAAAAVRADQTGEPSLVAYTVFHDGETATGSELRRYMREHVPHYMTPQFFIELPEMPLTQNNKVDRKALPPPAGVTGSPTRVAPRTEEERKLAAIWTDILNTDDISVSDNFFELGGHSLQVTRMVARARKTAGLAIAPRAVIFETLEQLVAGASAGSDPNSHA